MPPIDAPRVVTAASVLTTALLGLLMPTGIALLTCGLVRKKNAAHLVMLSISAFVFAVLAYYAVGYAVQFGAVIDNSGWAIADAKNAHGFLIGSGRWGIAGGRGFFLAGIGSTAGGRLDVLLEMILMLTAASVLVGAVCERINFWPFVGCVLLVAAIVYPLFGCWVWGGGWLSQLGATLGLSHGYVDVAGATVVHAIGGFCAMALAVTLGPRLGKYGPDGQPRPFPAHNLVFVGAGTFLMLLGWTALSASAGAAAANVPASSVALNALLAAAGGGAAAMLVWTAGFRLPDISMACNGMLAGLVAISAGCAFVGSTAAVAIGMLAGALVCGGVLFNERVLRIDDPCGSIAVHGYCGWFGAIAVGLFANGTAGAGWNGVGADTYMSIPGRGVTGLLYGDGRQFLVQVIGATACAAYALIAMSVLSRLVNAVRAIRVEPEAELEGLDLPEFGMLAYPEDERFS
jgi:Amt family ammonium transporter